MSEQLSIVLVRHGESSWNVEHRLTGWTDVPLTEKGKSQARALKPLLEKEAFDGVWSSDLQRARDTARLAYGEPQTDERLRELFFGELEGENWTTLVAPYKDALLDFDDFEAPGGESVKEVEARVMAFVSDLPPGKHVIFTHGGIVRVFLHKFKHTRQFLSNCAVVSIDWTKGEVLSVKELEG